MKDKTAAAKILLDNGWTLEEVLKVLGEEKRVEYVPAPYPVYPIYPTYPLQPWRFDWREPYITCNSGTSASFTVITQSDNAKDDYGAMAAMVQ